MSAAEVEAVLAPFVAMADEWADVLALSAGPLGRSVTPAERALMRGLIAEVRQRVAAARLTASP